MELLLSRYLEEAYSANSYAVNVYVVPGPQAIRLGRFSREDLENKKGPRVECFFRKGARKSKAVEKGSKRASKKASNQDPRPDGQNSIKFSNGVDASSSRKRKRQPTPDADDELDDFIVPDDNGMERDDSDNEDFSNELRRLDTQEPEPDNDDWTFSLDATHVNKKTRRSGGKSKSTCEPLDKTAWDDGEIISLSSD